MAEGVKAIASNTAKDIGGIELTRSYSDVLAASKTAPETRTSEEIINNIWSKLQAIDYDD